MHESKSALIVFAKVPEPNKVKTRLTSLISPEWASRVYESFLLDALEVYHSLDVDVRLYFSAPPSDVPDAYRFDWLTLHEQKGAGLGERMATAFAETFVKGYERAVIIGTDHPTLPVEFIEQAFQSLQDLYSIVIGPSDDGGYYLLGMNEFYSELFKDMTYSHEHVCAQTIARVEQTNASLHILPHWYDVDTPDALRRLIQEIQDSTFPLARTREIVEDLVTEYPVLAQ